MNTKKYISPGGWFSLQYPDTWNEFEDEEEKSKRPSACRKSYSWNDADRVWNVRAADRAKRGKRTE